FRVVAVGAERRGAGRADPFLAALVASLLLGEALAQGLEQLVEAPHRLDLLLLLFGEIFLGELLEPFGGNLGRDRVRHQVEALEDLAERAVELVEIALVLHQRRARQIVEVLDAARREVGLHRLYQRQVLTQGHRQAGGFQLGEEGDEHRDPGLAPPTWPLSRASSSRHFIYARNAHRTPRVRLTLARGHGSLAPLLALPSRPGGIR